jgi:hypothetical protein
LFTHHKCMEEILGRLKEIDCRLCSVHLVDSFYCWYIPKVLSIPHVVDNHLLNISSQPTTFLSAVLTVAASMLRLGLPHINVLSKVDLLPNYGPLPFNLDFYTEMTDLTPLTRYDNQVIIKIFLPSVIPMYCNIIDLSRYMDSEIPTEDQLGDMYDAAREYEIASEQEEHADKSGDGIQSDDRPKISSVMEASNRRARQYRKMTEAICELLTDMGLVSFLPLNIQDGEVPKYFRLIGMIFVYVVSVVSDRRESVSRRRQSKWLQFCCRRCREYEQIKETAGRRTCS